jgi:hypothetical protein
MWRIFCYFHIHFWMRRRATHNPLRLVRRCKKCGRVSVKQLRPAISSQRERPQPRVGNPAGP